MPSLLHFLHTNKAEQHPRLAVFDPHGPFSVDRLIAKAARNKGPARRAPLRADVEPGTTPKEPRTTTAATKRWPPPNHPAQSGLSLPYPIQTTPPAFLPCDITTHAHHLDVSELQPDLLTDDDDAPPPRSRNPLRHLPFSPWDARRAEQAPRRNLARPRPGSLQYHHQAAVRARNRAVVAEGLVWGVEEPEGWGTAGGSEGATSKWVTEKGMAVLRGRVAAEMRERRERGEGVGDEGGFRWCGRACVAVWPVVRGVENVSDLAAAKAFGAVVEKEEGVKMEEGVKKEEGMDITSEAAAELIKTAVRERESALRSDEMVEKALAVPREPEVEPLMTPASVRRAPSSAASSTGATAGDSSAGRAPSVRFSTARPSRSAPLAPVSPTKTSAARAALEWVTSFFTSTRAASTTASSAGASTTRPRRPRSAAARRQAALRSRSAINRDPWVDLRTRIGKETIMEEEEEEEGLEMPGPPSGSAAGKDEAAGVVPDDFIVDAWVADAWLSSVASVVDAEVASPSKSVVRKDSAVDLAAQVEANFLALLERDTIVIVDEDGEETLIV